MTSLQLLLSQGGITQLKWFSGLQRTFCDLFGLDTNVSVVSVRFLWHPHGPAPLCVCWDSSKGPFSWFAVDSSGLFLPTDVLEWSPQSSVSSNQNLISSGKNWHLPPFCPLPLTNVCVRAQSLSCVWLFVTQWTVAHQAPLSMGFSRQKYWDGLPFPSLRGLPKPWIKPMSPVSLAWQADPLLLSHLQSPLTTVYWACIVHWAYFKNHVLSGLVC